MVNHAKEEWTKTEQRLQSNLSLNEISVGQQKESQGKRQNIITWGERERGREREDRTWRGIRVEINVLLQLQLQWKKAGDQQQPGFSSILYHHLNDCCISRAWKDIKIHTRSCVNLTPLYDEDKYRDKKCTCSTSIELFFHLMILLCYVSSHDSLYFCVWVLPVLTVTSKHYWVKCMASGTRTRMNERRGRRRTNYFTPSFTLFSLLSSDAHDDHDDDRLCFLTSIRVSYLSLFPCFSCLPLFVSLPQLDSLFTLFDWSLKPRSTPGERNLI